jgi:hypothetical protein
VHVPWKFLGVAGLAGVAASGAVVARRRRTQQEYEPDDLRAKLHERLAEARATAAPDASAVPPPAAP